MRRVILPLLALPVILVGCGLNQNPLRVQRSACPAVGVLEYAGDATLFSPAQSRDASAIDVTATITNVRASCFQDGTSIISDASYTVLATRSQAAGPRTVTLPVFSAVVRAGDRLLSKDVGSVTLSFADGALSASTTASARSVVSEAAATLPEEINRSIDRRRKPGDPDAAIDPLARPEVREAVREATFEVLLGFNLDESSLAYNVAK
ncbi:MAG: hypothetical protein V2J26_02930 [Pacificimonas sp.]|jgi:hypothetical protein|nr:hypothetical protein [Pacificimonas sp.]